MSLILCETENAGMLREAATAKKDEKILHKICDKDCVAIEVRNHQKCYKNYTNFLYRQQQCTEAESPLVYAVGFEKFCKDVKDVIDPLVKQKKIEYMSYLYERLIKIVSQIEIVDARSFPKFRLKARLQNLYPQLVFYMPKI
jgi:hypothetical protein